MADKSINKEKIDPLDQVIIIEEKINKVNGDIGIKRYARGKLLGKGGFAKCYEVTNLESKKLYAAKIIPKATLTKNRARQKLISEIKIHKALRHQNIVQFEHVFEDQENVYILLEVCAHQVLLQLKILSIIYTRLQMSCQKGGEGQQNQKYNLFASKLSVVQNIFTQIEQHFTKHQVIHRDLKLGNLFLTKKMELKAGDFGLATKLEFDGEKKRTICGTPNYIAPEILDGKVGHSYEVDIWSFGVIIYTLLIGKPPFETPDVKTTYKKIKQNSYSFPDHVIISDNARNLITKILVLEPSKRPTLEDISSHSFMNDSNNIPKFLPTSVLACPPSDSFLKQYLPQGKQLIKTEKNRALEYSQSNQSKTYNRSQNNFHSTERNNSQNKFQGMKDSMRSSTSEQMKNFNSTKTLNSQWVQQNQNQQINTLTSMGNFSNSKQQQMISSSSIKSEIWVKKWVDYSSKYGLGYMLSNGSTGVFFNDSTKIVLHPNGSYFEYMERKPSDRQDIISQLTFQDFPKELQKKVTLLQHFRNYLEGENKQEIHESTVEINKNVPLVYLKKWMKTRHAIMFRLSNKIVQVNFTDRTEVILSSEHKMLTYVNKKGERSNYPLASALESTNIEMTKRLKYTKEILAHMLNNPNGQQDINQSRRKIIFIKKFIGKLAQTFQSTKGY